MVARAIAVLLLCGAMAGQEKLLTKENVIAFSLNAGLRTADAVLTCQNLSHGAREYSAPFQSCAGVSMWTLSGIPAQVFGVWMLQKHGHRKMARLLAWGMPVSDAGYLAVTVKNR